MKKVSSYILKYWYLYLIALVAMVISIRLDMQYPQITQSIIDDVILSGEMNILPKLLIGLLIIGFGRAIFQYLKEFIFDVVSIRIASDIRKHVFDHIQSLSIKFFDANNTGELMTRVKDDVDKVWNALGFVGMLSIEVVIHTSMVLYFMFRISPKLTIIPVIIIVIVACIAIIMERKLGKVYESISEENATLNMVAEENLAGVRAVKSFVREKHEIKKFLKHNKRYYELNMKQSNVFVRYYPYIQFITKALPISLIIIGGFMVINEEITLGQLGAFVEYSGNIVWPMEMLGWLTNGLASAFASNKKIKTVLSAKSDICEMEKPKNIEEVNGTITFDNVSFALNDSEILKNISFHVEVGKTIGIMGATGAGKSSIINLLQRFYDVDSGEIRLDNIPIKELALKQLRSNISVVMQDVFLFSDTIEENIKLGQKHLIDEETMVSSVAMAQAKDFIENMNDQYETIIGERGVGLSGGQKQRISIARAIAKNSPILVLDDSTSALDMETEHLIQSALLELSTTKVIIAHRISAVKNADEIIILEDGKIVERGKHDELLKKRGLYYDTYMAQYGDVTKEVQ